jgi:hypothetical protein
MCMCITRKMEYWLSGSVSAQHAPSARPVTWGKSFEVGSAHNTCAGAMSVECAAVGSRRQSVSPCSSFVNSVGSMCKRRALPSGETLER